MLRPPQKTLPLCFVTVCAIFCIYCRYKKYQLSFEKDIRLLQPYFIYPAWGGVPDWAFWLCCSSATLETVFQGGLGLFVVRWGLCRVLSGSERCKSPSLAHRGVESMQWGRLPTASGPLVLPPLTVGAQASGRVPSDCELSWVRARSAAVAQRVCLRHPPPFLFFVLSLFFFYSSAFFFF